MISIEKISKIYKNIQASQAATSSKNQQNEEALKKSLWAIEQEINKYSEAITAKNIKKYIENKEKLERNKTQVEFINNSIELSGRMQEDLKKK